MTTTCSHCGAATAPSALFCSGCGRSLSQASVAIATPPGVPTLSGAPTLDILGTLRIALAGRYDVERELGRGGMATVFLAREPRHDREVAIKVLHPELAATLGGDRFEREIRLAAKLQHPHILGLYDSGVAEGLLYYVMPFVRGESLRDRLAREGQLPVDEAIQITLEVADALGHAHDHGIIHRDVKPENILLANGHALVADFGIARALSEADSHKLTQTGMAVGTPVYMAPEQSMGEKVGPQADIYSLACVLFELLAGEPPFAGKNATAIMARHAMEPPRSVRVVRSAVPEEVEEAIFAALEKSPADRPKSAAAFAQLLGAAPGSTATMRVRGYTATRRLPSNPYITTAPPAAPVARWRRPAMLGALGAIVALLLAGAAAWRFAGRGAASGTAGNGSGRVAVLYFDDRSAEHTLGPLADGLTEGLIDALASAPSLTVISRDAVARFRGAAVAPDSVARAVRAGYLVRGEVEPERDDIRVTLRLDDASGVNLRRVSFRRPAGNLLAIRDTLTDVAAELLRAELGQELRLKAQRASTASADAWLLVQRGEQARRRGEAAAANGDPAGNDRAFSEADTLLARAATADPRWPQPELLRGVVAYRRSRLVGRDPALIRRWVDSGVVHVARALALAPQLPDGLELRGNLRYWSWLMGLEADPVRQKALLDSARADLEKATTLNPRQAGAWATLSHLYYQVATPTEVQIAAQRALEADEFLSNADVILGRLFLSSYDLGQFDKAEQWCGELGRRFAAIPLAVRCRLYLLTTKNKAPDVALAWRLADSVVARAPAAQRPAQRLFMDMLVGAVIARASRTTPALADSARHVVRRATGDATIDPARDAAYTGAWVYSLLGDRDAALQLLREYLAANPGRVDAFRDDPGWWFRDMAGDPRFRRLVGATE
ncbi:protein kinase [Gemmatirosa kalamazoonensis]|uniref:non-specific serine/threonine protein kinase n=1 Tax=Gemmatirosa kalamazoonensis TaxID=861299 RepID=W0RMH8_9BACT|nr:serine/threonine-protein kinase [Gemmatirosa kalamazoonensis]AHG91672.1 protein kinase [Gemmatirosa kalamazoonensis]